MISLTKQLSQKRSVVLFWADWCEPCKKLESILQNIEDEFSTDFSFFIVDTDQESDLAIKYGIRSLPTCLITDNGQVLSSFVGVKDEQEITSLLNNLIRSNK